MKDIGVDVTWDAASTYCSDLVLNDTRGWRLPEIEELERIYDVAHGSKLKGDIGLSGWADNTMSPRLKMTARIWTATKNSSGSRLAFNVFWLQRDYAAQDAGRVLCVHTARE